MQLDMHAQYTGRVHRAQVTFIHPLALCSILCAPALSFAQDVSLATPPPSGVQTRWSTPENPSGAPGRGNMTNRGAKGHAWDAIPAGASLALLDTTGSGRVTRIRLTLQNRSPSLLRSLRFEVFWDGEKTPAIRSPLGDLFGTAFGLTPRFENAYMADPEEHSLLLQLPMPFRTGARIVITNDGSVDESQIYWEVDWEKNEAPAPESLYLHAFWRRAQPPVGEDFDILPAVHGRGRFLGAVVGVQANPVYALPGRNHDTKTFWWGEGEVRMFVDDPGVQLQGPAAAVAHPTLAGTGGEDYFGTAWGIGHFTTMQAGCTVADPASLRWSCYRFHAPDPVWFHQGIRVAIQQIGGSPIAEARAIAARGAPMEVVAVDGARYTRLLDEPHPPQIQDSGFPEGWVLYHRSDDWSAVAFFYLDSPTDDLPVMQAEQERVRTLPD